VETAAVERHAKIDITYRGCQPYLYSRSQFDVGKVTLLLSPIIPRPPRQVDRYGYGTGQRVSAVACPRLFPLRAVTD
jgi:hypothetical protein